MNDTRYYSREFMTEFIELYKSLPELWNIKSKEYADRNKKKAAYEKLVEKFKEVEPFSTREMVTRKINSMRTSRRKVKVKMESNNFNDNYEPSLWYYNLLDFLDNPESNADQSSLDGSLSQDQSADNLLKYEGSDLEAGMSSPEHQPPSHSSINSPTERTTSKQSYFPHSPIIVIPEDTAPKRPKKRSIEVNVSDSIGKQLSEVEPDHTHELFGRYITHKLRHLPKNQSIHLKKIINDAVFEAELGNLDRGCYIHIPKQDRK